MARDCSIHNFVLKMSHSDLFIAADPLFRIDIILNEQIIFSISIYVCRKVVLVVTISYSNIPSLGRARPQSPTRNHFYT